MKRDSGRPIGGMFEVRRRTFSALGVDKPDVAEKGIVPSSSVVEWESVTIVFARRTSDYSEQS